ncbi:unnamed protein product [Chilo suppressalis]|uniref:Caspase family p20 domain-containing protein n=1 Tax=Chilo suppressalis TaxID=168631 RepID=A0ABN8L515_CHISP|nr:unnamed protein product [Chilo suppressalis]
MSLLQNLSYEDYQQALTFSKEKCEIIAELANLKITLDDTNKPGEKLIKYLYRRGYSAAQYKQFLSNSQQVKTIVTYYKPQSKIAILIANSSYNDLSKLATPSVDCDSLAASLKNLGFIVLTLKNTLSSELQNILVKMVDVIPEDSYCFIFYAGHGCELCNTKCMLCIDCPTENIEMKHCVTENFVLKEVARCKPDLCIFIMDMCRMNLDRCSNPKMFEALANIEDYTIHSNLLVVYSTQSSAYEVLQIECSTTIDANVTYELKTGDTDKILPGSSQYVNALCTRLGDDLDISNLLDKVHGDVEKSFRKQRPIKVQCGVAKRSLYDPVKGNVAAVLAKVKDETKEFKNAVIF